MTDKIIVIVKKVTQTCSACPSQWEAETSDGKYLYVRYRWGHLSIRKGNTIDEAVMLGESIVELDIGGGLDGSMTYADLTSISSSDILWP